MQRSWWGWQTCIVLTVADFTFSYNARIAYLKNVYLLGTNVHHAKYGTGRIVDNSGSVVTVEFEDVGVKKFGIIVVAANGILTTESEDFNEKMEQYRSILKKE